MTSSFLDQPVIFMLSAIDQPAKDPVGYQNCTHDFRPASQSTWHEFWHPTRHRPEPQNIQLLTQDIQLLTLSGEHEASTRLATGQTQAQQLDATGRPGAEAAEQRGAHAA